MGHEPLSQLGVRARVRAVDPGAHKRPRWGRLHPGRHGAPRCQCRAPGPRPPPRLARPTRGPSRARCAVPVAWGCGCPPWPAPGGLATARAGPRQTAAAAGRPNCARLVGSPRRAGSPQSGWCRAQARLGWRRIARASRARAGPRLGAWVVAATTATLGAAPTLG